MAAMGECALLRQASKPCNRQHSGMPGEISDAQHSTLCGKDEPAHAIYLPVVSPGGEYRFGAGTTWKMDSASKPLWRQVEAARNGLYRSTHQTVAHCHCYGCVAWLLPGLRRSNSLTGLADARRSYNSNFFLLGRCHHLNSILQIDLVGFIDTLLLQGFTGSSCSG